MEEVREIRAGVTDPGFIFDHLPKTGGTALRAAFEQIFGPGEVSPPVLGRTERWAEENFSGYRMIIGHFHNPVPLVGRCESRIRLTVLRHPLDRVVSEYYYFRNDVRKLPWHNLALYSKDHDLFGYLKLLEAQGNAAVSNRYAHHLAAQLARGPWRESRLLSLAKEAIASYDFVGIQEQLADCVDLFCGTYGLPAIAEIPQANVTSNRLAFSELDPRTRERLVQLNRVDLELYDFVRSRFQAWKRAALRQFARTTIACDTYPVAERPASLKAPTSEFNANMPTYFGDQTVQFTEVSVTGSTSMNDVACSGEELLVNMVITSDVDVPDLTVGLHIVDDVGELVFGTNTHLLRESRPVVAGESYRVRFVLKADMRSGRYTLGGSLHTGASHLDRCFYWCEKLASFDVIDCADKYYVGYCRLDAWVEWDVAPVKIETA